MSRLREHNWVDVGFIHVKLVCKHCDKEKDSDEVSLYCRYIETDTDRDNDEYPHWVSF